MLQELRWVMSIGNIETGDLSCYNVAFFFCQTYCKSVSKFHVYSWCTSALIIQSVHSCVYIYIYILYTVCRYTVYVCIHVIQIILLYRHARPLVIPLGHISIWQYVPVHSCLYDYIPWLCGNFGGEHLPQKALLGIDHFAQDGKNHAVVLLYKWATGQWFQCTFHYISFRWANRMVWMFNLQWFGHILELNQTLLDVKTPLHYFNPSIRCCLCWYLIWKSLQTALGSSARSGWQRTRWNCLWAWWSITCFWCLTWTCFALSAIECVYVTCSHIQ